MTLIVHLTRIVSGDAEAAIAFPSDLEVSVYF